MKTDKNFEVGDIVSWNSEAGHVSGKVVAIHSSAFMVNGYEHHATAETPQYAIRSLKTGHLAYHKGSALVLQGRNT